MKRLCLIFLLALFTIGLQAQRMKVLSAWHFMKDNYNELDKAKQAIDAAVLQGNTSSSPKAWYYRAQCYHRLYLSNDKQLNSLDPNPLYQAYQSYLKVKELDQKGKYEDIDYQLELIEAEFFNKGSAEYAAKKYAEALESFETVMEMSVLPFTKPIDTQVYFYAAIAADQALMYGKALQYYQKAIDSKTNGVDVYHYVASLHMARGDTTQAIQSYLDGIEAFPDDNTYLYIQLLNYYLYKGDQDLIAKYIEPAVQKDSTNSALWIVYGSTFEHSNRDKAIYGYQKALEQDSSLFDCYYNIGTIYFNQGVDAKNRANEIAVDDEAGYQSAIAKRDAFFEQALPYFESAFKLDNSVSSLLLALKEIYNRLQMKEKLNEINFLIESRK